VYALQSKADTLKKQVRENDILLNIHEKYSKKKSLFYSIKKKKQRTFWGWFASYNSIYIL
uniref:hypothetical protein n=1 Tax=[Ruminococcus] torques TaxID=33039 RepID=UPI00402A93C8